MQAVVLLQPVSFLAKPSDWKGFPLLFTKGLQEKPIITTVLVVDHRISLKQQRNNKLASFSVFCKQEVYDATFPLEFKLQISPATGQ